MFSCDICDFVFKTQRNLNSHIIKSKLFPGHVKLQKSIQQNNETIIKDKIEKKTKEIKDKYYKEYKKKEKQLNQMNKELNQMNKEFYENIISVEKKIKKKYYEEKQEAKKARLEKEKKKKIRLEEEIKRMRLREEEIKRVRLKEEEKMRLREEEIKRVRLKEEEKMRLREEEKMRLREEEIKRVHLKEEEKICLEGYKPFSKKKRKKMEINYEEFLDNSNSSDEDISFKHNYETRKKSSFKKKHEYKNIKENSSNQLKTHLRVNIEEKPYKCNFIIEGLECNKEFTRRRCLISHQRIHTGEKPFYCELCKGLFRTSNFLKKHKCTYNKRKLFNCIKCKEKFISKSQIKNHNCKNKPFIQNLNVQPNIHNNIITPRNQNLKNYCDYRLNENNLCNKQFSSLNNVETHKKYYHPNLNNEEEKNLNNDIINGNWLCCFSESKQKIYYYNTRTCETTWKIPKEYYKGFRMSLKNKFMTECFDSYITNDTFISLYNSGKEKDFFHELLKRNSWIQIRNDKYINENIVETNDNFIYCYYTEYKKKFLYLQKERPKKFKNICHMFPIDDIFKNIIKYLHPKNKIY